MAGLRFGAGQATRPAPEALKWQHPKRTTVLPRHPDPLRQGRLLVWPWPALKEASTAELVGTGAWHWHDDMVRCVDDCVAVFREMARAEVFEHHLWATGVRNASRCECLPDLSGARVMRDETSTLLATLHDLDGELVEVMLGLLTDELSAEEQRRFGRLFVAAGKMLEQHAELVPERGSDAGPPTTAR